MTDSSNDGIKAVPALWNPNAAACWSLIFTPIFGATLHMRNWEALGQSEKAEKSKRWVIGSIAYFVVVLLSGLIAPDSRVLDGLSKIVGLVLLITWYYSIGKSQQYFVLAKLDGTYQHKGWLKPIFAALGVFVLVLLAGGVLALVFGAAGAA